MIRPLSALRAAARYVYSMLTSASARRSRGGSWLVGSLDREHIGLERKHARFAQERKRRGRIAHDHANDSMIDGIGGRQRVDVNSRFRQLVTHAGKCAGTIRKENGEVGGRFDREAWGVRSCWFETDAGNRF